MDVLDALRQHFSAICSAITTAVVAGPRVVSWGRNSVSWTLRRIAEMLWKQL